MNVENSKKNVLIYYNKKYSLQERDYLLYFILILYLVSPYTYFLLIDSILDMILYDIAVKFHAILIIGLWSGLLIIGFLIGIIEITFNLNRKRVHLLVITSIFIFNLFLSFFPGVATRSKFGTSDFIFEILLFSIFISLFTLQWFYIGYLLGRVLKLTILQYEYFTLMMGKNIEEIKAGKEILITNILKSPVKTFSILVLSSILYIFFIIYIYYYCIKHPEADKPILGLGYILIILISIWCLQKIYNVLKGFIKKRR